MGEQLRHADFRDRFRDACLERGLKTTQIALGKFFGVSEISARRWWHGYQMPGIDRACDIAEKLGINVEWLLTGRGSRYPSDVTPPLDRDR